MSLQGISRLSNNEFRCHSNAHSCLNIGKRIANHDAVFGPGAREVGESMLEQADLRLAAMALSNVMRTPLRRGSAGHSLQRGLEAGRSDDRAAVPGLSGTVASVRGGACARRPRLDAADFSPGDAAHWLSTSLAPAPSSHSESLWSAGGPAMLRYLRRCCSPRWQPGQLSAAA